MDTLSEEILDLISSEVCGFWGYGHAPAYPDAVRFSLVSHKLHRIMEPILYRSIVLDHDNLETFLNTMSARPGIHRHIKHLHMPEIYDLDDDKRQFVQLLPNLTTLSLNISKVHLPGLMPFLKLPSVSTLYVRGFQPGSMWEEYSGDWEFTNDAITTLDISFAQPDAYWEDCDEIDRLATVFQSLAKLRLHSRDENEEDQEGQNEARLDAYVFRRMVHVFQHALQTTLREFDFGYNVGRDDEHRTESQAISDRFDAKSVIKQSHLSRVKVDTNCLLQSVGAIKRSLHLFPLSFPPTLRSLYLRHAVNLRSIANGENLMYSEEAQCLSLLIQRLGAKSLGPCLQQITLAVFLPFWFQDVAATVVRKNSRQLDRAVDVVFAPSRFYGLGSDPQTWPEYSVALDPRHSSYDPTTLQPQA